MLDRIESVKKILKVLESDVIDDPEDLLEWLGSDGIEILKEYLELKFDYSKIYKRIF